MEAALRNLLAEWHPADRSEAVGAVCYGFAPPASGIESPPAAPLPQ
jgi:hypothetical protein